MFETINDDTSKSLMNSLFDVLKDRFHPFVTKGVDVRVEDNLDFRSLLLTISIRTLSNDPIYIRTQPEDFLDNTPKILKGLTKQIDAYFDRIYIQPESNILLGEN